jgi:tetratricopeptide (TPR) repeat protein
MKKYLYILFLSFIVSIFSSCEKYLNTVPAGVIVPKTIENYGDLLKSFDVITKLYYYSLHYGTDDLKATGYHFFSNYEKRLYVWQYPVFNRDQKPYMWSQPYKAIYNYNVILEGLKDIDVEDKQEEKILQQIKGEALLGRAFEHLILLNTFAKPYNKVTAQTDPGVPYVIVADISAKTPGRSTIEKTYERIFTDLKNAINLLPEKQKINKRGTIAAAHGVFARACLYKGDYKLALEHAEKALEGNEDRLLNYVDYFSNNFPRGSVDINNPMFTKESIYYRDMSNNVHRDKDKILHSKEYIDLYPDNVAHQRGDPTYSGVKDFRTVMTMSTRVIHRNWDKYKDAAIFMPMLIPYGITFPEMLLTKAEAMVRTDNLQGALNVINLLRKNRIRNVVDLTSSNKEEVLGWVLKERRCELFKNGLRWFDMRRLSSEPERITPLTRTVIDESGTNTYTLQPKNYTFLIPFVVIEKNPGMKQNPE